MAGIGDLFNKVKDNVVNQATNAAGQAVNGQVQQGRQAAQGQVQQATQPLTNAIGGFLGRVRDGVQEAGQVAGNVAKVTGAKTILNTQYPETISLGQSPRMNTFVENGLSALDLYKGKPDGRPDAGTLAGINALRATDGQAPHADVNQVTRDDVGLMVDQLARKGTPHANNVLDAAVSTLGNLKGDYPKPAEPAAAAAPPAQRSEPVAP